MINKHDFRLFDINNLPVLNEKMKKDILSVTGKCVYTNTSNKEMLRIYLSEKFHNKCAYCGAKLYKNSDKQIDHFHPRTKQNVNDINNLVLSCEFCNHNKSNFDPADIIYPYSNNYSNMFKRDICGGIVSNGKELLLDEFAQKMKFDSVYHTLIYVSLLLEKTIEKNDMKDSKQLLKFKQKIDENMGVFLDQEKLCAKHAEKLNALKHVLKYSKAS